MFTRTGKLYITLGVLLLLIITGSVFLYFTTAAPNGNTKEKEESRRFVVSQKDAKGEAIEKLEEENFIRSSLAFVFIHRGKVAPGAYRLSSTMSAFEISQVIQEGPYMKWVVIPEGVRKEEIGELLGRELLWSKEKVEDFIVEETQRVSELAEGVFFPDTYLIAKDESTARVAERLHSAFNEAFAPYLEESLRQNIRWPTLVKIASLIQREAAGEEDMNLISGILWNRLLDGKRLELDATVQYVRDTLGNYIFDEEGNILSYTGELGKESGWWRPIALTDKRQDVFNANTYLHTGLPDTPIANPGLKAIEATLFPEETECYFYIHEDDGTIHCARTLDEHEENIERYLR